MILRKQVCLWLCVFSLFGTGDLLSVAPVATPSDVKHCPKAALLLKKRQYEHAYYEATEACPTLRKAARWFWALEGGKEVPLSVFEAALHQKNRWPWWAKIRRRGERVLAEDHGLATVTHYFRSHDPQTIHGLTIYVRLLKRAGNHQKALALVQHFWHRTELAPDKQSKFLTRFHDMLTPADDLKRANYFLDQENLDQVEQLQRHRPLRNARLKVAYQFLSKHDAALENYFKLSAQDRENPQVVYSYLKWLSARSDPAAYTVIRSVEEVILKNPEQYRKVLMALARDALGRGAHQEALYILNLLPVAHSELGVDTIFLKAFILYRMMDSTQEACHILEKTYPALKTNLSQTRFAYWIGRAYADLQKTDKAQHWFHKAYQHPRTYYGQLAAEEVSHPIQTNHFKKRHFSEQDRHAVESNELVQALQILSHLGMTDEVPSFYYALNTQLTPRQRQYLFDLILKRTPQHAVDAAKALGFASDYLESYPLLTGRARTMVSGDPALVHAVIRRESRFMPTAISNKNAMGLLQVIPSTAEKLCKEMKIPFDVRKLTCPDFNLKLGCRYLRHLHEKFNGYLPMVLAAYNAGPSQPIKWAKTYGDPRQNEIETIDWIELIPYSETRNYIQRVLEAYGVYKARLGKM